MTPTEKQIAGNLLIAEATGWRFNQSEETKDLYPMGYWTMGDDEDWSKAEDLKFHNDWNWLMDAMLQLGFNDCSTDIEQAWNSLVDQLRAQAN